MITLSLEALYKYTSAAPSSQNMVEGENVMNSGLILMCGAAMKSSVNINVFSLCL